MGNDGTISYFFILKNRLMFATSAYFIIKAGLLSEEPCSRQYTPVQRNNYENTGGT